jgi:hypothetical protein
MLEPWIIEQIRRREEEERQGHQRPRLEIPTREERDGWHDPEEKEDRDQRREREREKRNDENPERGVTIIDFGVA